MALQITFFTIITLCVMGSQAEDVCPNDPPIWLAALDSVVPLIGIIASFSYFVTVHCCSEKHKKYFQKFLRGISLLNWIIFWVSMAFLILSCEKVGKSIFHGVENTEWVFGAAVVVSWLVMMLESYVSRERWYIKHLGKKRSVLLDIGTMRNTQPTVMWTVVGYNYEDRQVPVRTIKLPCSTPVVKFDDSKVSYF